MIRLKTIHASRFLTERPGSFLFVFCLIGMVVSAYVSLHLFWADSEMWPQAAARNLWNRDSNQDFFIKPIFNLLLWLFYKIAIWRDQFPLDIARIFMSFNLAVILVLVFRIIRRISQSELLAIIGVLFLLTTITILEQGTRVRSDMLVCTLNLITLDWILRRSSTSLRVWIPALLSLFITPKAIYWIIAFYPFFPTVKQLSKQQIKIILGTVIGTAFIILIFRYQTIFALVKYFISSFTKTGSGLPYFHLIRFEHIVAAIQKDFLFWFLIFIRLLWVRSFKGFDAFFVILVVALMFHPERMPFFIAALMPFFLISAFSHSAFTSFFKKIQAKGGWIFVISVGLISIFALHRFLLRADLLVEKHNNTVQREAINLVQDYVMRVPSIKIYDPAGIIYKLPTYDWFIGPAEIDNNHLVMRQLKDVKPDIILYTMRVLWLEPEVYGLLKDDYINLGGGVYGHYPLVPIQPKQKFLMPNEILQALPDDKVISDPKAQVRIFVFDEKNNEISEQGRWWFSGDAKSSLGEAIAFRAFQTSVVKVQLPPNANKVRVSFWGVFEYNLTTPIYSLFRFDAEL